MSGMRGMGMFGFPSSTESGRVLCHATTPRRQCRSETALGPLRFDRLAGYKVISPLPVALVEGRRREQGCPPGTPDSLGARKAKVLHQVNQVIAESKIRWQPVDRFYARHFDLPQGSC